MSPVCLRHARSTDAGKLGDLMSEAIAAKPWKPRLRTGAEDIALAAGMIDAGWVVVAADDEGVAGFMARDAGYIHALFIHPRARNKGVGGALVGHAKAEEDRLDLWTFEANTGARRFYLREGFAEVARADGSGNDEGLPEVHYRWTREGKR